jgi:DNA-binding HxlR family transcriptional regulator
MTSIPEHSGQVCDRFHAAIERIGRRWTGAIISSLLKGATRFCEIREAIPGISDRLLTERLKELEENGIVARDVSSARPPQVSYCLTEKGKALEPALDAVADRAERWGSGETPAE